MTCIPDEWLSTTEPGLSASFHSQFFIFQNLIFPVCSPFGWFCLGLGGLFFINYLKNIDSIRLSMKIYNYLLLEDFSNFGVDIGKKWGIVGASGEKWVFQE